MGKRLGKILFVLAALLAPVCLPAQNDVVSLGDDTCRSLTLQKHTAQNNVGFLGDDISFPELTEETSGYTLDEEKPEAETPETPETPEAPEIPEAPQEKKKFRLKNRTWELSIANISVDVANNAITVPEIMRDPVVINLDRFFDGFKFNVGASIKPFSFNFNWKDKWGFGLDIAHIDITGNMSLSGRLITLSEAAGNQFGVGGAVFVDVGAPVFFHYRKFKIQLRPAAYVPVIYTEPKITYTYTEIDDGTRFELNYDIRVYSLVSMENMGSLRGIPPNNLGWDFGLNVEYSLFDNLDLGVDMVNIPIPFAAAKLYHYMHLNGLVWVDTSKLDIEDLIQNGTDFDSLKGTVFDYPDEFTPEYRFNAAGKKIYRPFAMVTYAHYRPFESRLLTLIPSLGFSINYLYPKIIAVEGGLDARLDLANIFIATLGIHYNDRRWKNSVDFILNLRAFELGLGVSLQSQDFVRSWQGAGLGINFGLKFGW